MTSETPEPEFDWDDSMVTDPDSVRRARPGSHREPPARRREILRDDASGGHDDSASPPSGRGA